MAGAASTRRILPSLAVELPDGWSVSETATFASPSGTDIHVRVGRVSPDVTGAGLADRLEAAATVELTDVGEVEASTVSLPDGRDAHVRRFPCRVDGVSSLGQVACVVDSGFALAAFGAWPVTAGGAHMDLELLLAGFRPPGLPPSSQPLVDPSSTRAVGRPATTRSTADVSTWSTCRPNWSSSTPDRAEVRRVARWSTAELAVCAWVLGADSFPTVEVEHWASLPMSAFEIVVDTVTRSFLARGLLRADEDGQAELIDDVRELMDVAAFPDLTISVERLRGSDYQRWWFGLRPDRGVQVVVRPDGSRDVGELDPGRVVAHIFALADVEASLPTGEQAHDVAQRVSLADLVGGVAPISALTKVTTGWRVGDVISGGSVTWAEGPDRSLWLADIDPVELAPTWDLRPAGSSDVRAEVLAHLP